MQHGDVSSGLSSRSLIEADAEGRVESREIHQQSREIHQHEIEANGANAQGESHQHESHQHESREQELIRNRAAGTIILLLITE
jgi:hypothetical protein